MIAQDYLSLCDAADELGIELWRLARLGRYLGIDPLEKRLTRQEVRRVRQENAPAMRYNALLRWLLNTTFHSSPAEEHAPVLKDAELPGEAADSLL